MYEGNLEASDDDAVVSDKLCSNLVQPPVADVALVMRWDNAAAGRLDPATPTVTIASFGMHLTTMLESVSAIRHVLPSSFEVVMVLYGASHPPPAGIIQEVCPADIAVGDLVPPFRCYMSMNPSEAFWQAAVDRPQMKESMDALASVLSTDTILKQADMMVCGGGHSPTLCLLLRMVTDMPMLFNIQAPLTFRMPREKDQRALLVAFFREMTRPPTEGPVRGRTVSHTSLLFFQRQFWAQTGRLLPVVRNHNLYASLAPSVVAQPPNPAKDEVLFWQNHVSLKADCAMTVWRLMKQTVLDDFPFRIVFKNMDRLPSEAPGRKVYALRARDNIMVGYADLQRRFVGAVLFPHDLGMISFDDLYALGVPLFMPDTELVAAMAFAHLASTHNYPWYLLREEHADLRFTRADQYGPPPWDPGWGGAEALKNQSGSAAYLGYDMLDYAKVLRAVSISNFVLFPHVRRFSSLAALLRDLGRAGCREALSATSVAMRRFADEAWETTAAFYRRAVAYLLGPALARASTAA